MEKGRKNIRPFIITAMVALIALVVGMGGYTFAKYFTSTGTHSNQATVAKWGFVLSANATNLFGEEYRDTEILLLQEQTQELLWFQLEIKLLHQEQQVQ